MERYILSHDMGTGSDKAVLVDYSGNIAATAVAPYPTFYPNPAWAEQDPEDYWKAVAQSSRRIIEDTGISPEQIKGIVFSTQAQGIIPVDRDGAVLYNNITWVDGRAQKQAENIMKKLGGKKLFSMVAGSARRAITTVIFQGQNFVHRTIQLFYLQIKMKQTRQQTQKEAATCLTQRQ